MSHSPRRAGKDAPPSPPAIWAVAGGKGGVGRSLLVANMGIQMARQGKRVAVADLDLEGSSLHTYLGIHRVSRTLGGLMESGEVTLASLLLDTSLSNLKLLAGVQHPLSPSDKAALAEGFVRLAPSLNVEHLIVDCGSGRSGEILELIRASHLTILVATPEPTAAESLYLFTEALVQRVLESKLSADELEKLEIARSLEEYDQTGRASFRAAVERLRSEGESFVERILDALRPIQLRLILNQVRTEAEGDLARILKTGFEKFFGLDLKPVGSVEYDLSVLQSIQKRKPLSQQYPNSPATQGVERAVSALLATLHVNGGEPPPLSRDMATLDYYRLLEVDPGATSKEIQQTYQILKRAYDPDSPFLHPLLSAGYAERVGSLVEMAYRTLIFLETRTEYDRKLVADGILLAGQIRSPGAETASIPAQAEKPIPRPSREESPAPFPAAAGKEGGGIVTPPVPPVAPGGEEQVPGRGLPVTGRTLRQYREARKLSVEDLVAKTKIRPSILEALEEDRFADLPAPVFLKGFLRQLAKCLGLDPAVVCREYMNRVQSTSQDPGNRAR